MLAFRIALRYLFSKKTHNAVNVISLISVLGVAVATTAIVVVLSVFNGFTDLSHAHLSAIDPQMKVIPVRGKVIADADSLCGVVAALPGVAAAIPAIDERALMIAGDGQTAVVMKAVPDGYGLVSDVASTVIDGFMPQQLYIGDSLAVMLASVGVASKLRIRPDVSTPVHLYVPRRVGNINPANPMAAFREAEAVVSGVFRVNQSEYDTEYVIVPLSVARDMLDYTTEATSVDVAVNNPDAVEKVQKSLQAALGPDYKVLGRVQQQSNAFKMISVEKWMTFAMLAFILVIASFNIISTLSLLVIEKADNIFTMRAIGFKKVSVTSVFAWQGWLISVAGGVLGIIIGVALSLLQQYGKVIKLAGDPASLTIDVYPVRVAPSDILVVLALVIVAGAITSQITRLFLRKYK